MTGVQTCALPIYLEEDEKKGFLLFYRASRASGDWWDARQRDTDVTRDVYICIMQDRIRVYWGAAWEEMRKFDFPFDEQPEDRLARFIEKMPFYPNDVEHAEKIVFASLGIQWKYEWDPGWLAGQVIINCGNPRIFRRHIRHMLKHLA